MPNRSESSQILPVLTEASSLNFKAAEKSPADRLEAKDSWFAAGFLSLYLAVYLAAGFVGVAAIEWVWTKLFA